MSIEFIDVKKLAARIAEVKEELAHLLHLESFVGSKPKAKRGRKPGSTAAKAPKAKAAKRGKRGALGEGILKFLSTKGKEGAHVKDIASATSNQPANVTAYFYGTGKKNKGIRRVKPGTFAYVPKE